MSRLRENGRTKANNAGQHRSTIHINKFYKGFFKAYLTKYEKTRELIEEENEQQIY